MPRSANLSNTSLITYDDIRVEDLEDEYSVLMPTGNLKEDFRSLFNKELSVLRVGGSTWWRSIQENQPPPPSCWVEFCPIVLNQGSKALL